MIDLDPADTRPLYSQIMDEIRRGVVLGTWGANEPLPSVRQLSSELGVNPNTVQQAYRELERDGVVYVLRGQGTFVSDSAAATERGPMLRALAREMVRQAYRSGFNASELVEALRLYATEETVDRGDVR